MIYLSPLGGLCNRMRTIDSLIEICSRNKVDLTVLWVTDLSLNCSFFKLFEKIEVDGIHFEIIDCPTGFPENFFKNPQLFDGLEKPTISIQKVRKIKNILKGRFLNKNHLLIKKALGEINAEQVLLNKDFASLYNSQNKLTTRTAREMDLDFISLVYPMIEKKINKNKCYISSCYRMSKLVGSYSNFRPVLNLEKRVTSLSNNFDNTIGLHIRRSDHNTAKAFSTTEKFINVIESEIKKDYETTFFLSTDDSETKNNLIREYGKSILFSEVTSYNRNNPKAVQDAVVDLYCLSKTRKIYGSHHSSFSQTAADIGRIEEITAK